MTYEMLKNMYQLGWVDSPYLKEAVSLGWITETEKLNILNEIEPTASSDDGAEII